MLDHRLDETFYKNQGMFNKIIEKLISERKSRKPTSTNVDNFVIGEWTPSYDFASLYPTTQRSYNPLPMIRKIKIKSILIKLI